MNRRSLKGLKISKETLRSLSPTALGGAGGGWGRSERLCGADTATNCEGYTCYPTKGCPTQYLTCGCTDKCQNATYTC